MALASNVTRVPVALQDAPHDVVVGPGLLSQLAGLVPVPPHARKVALLTCAPVAAHYRPVVEAELAAAGLKVHVVEVPDGETAKSLSTLEAVYRRLAAIPLDRGDLVVGLGGGVVTDLAGFVAATWHRGVAVVQLPTTLLGQVDAAIGGKTAVNLPEGKNLVGAFHQPSAVIADTATLRTLPERERRSGLGEVAKYGFIADAQVLELLEREPERAVAGDAELLTDVVVRGVAVKARVVAADEREAGERALLNYGHTVGHAVEALAGYGRYSHGEAVALGMVAAARLGEALGVSEPGLAERTVALLRPLGLPTGGLALDPEQLWTALQRDKKARDGVRFVLCVRPGTAVVVDPPERRLVDEVLRSLR
jgi:3-dehydroquinate synthase